MAASAPAEPIEIDIATTPRWSLATRVGFRFCTIYFSLYCLTNQILSGVLPIPKVEFPELDTLWPTRHMVLWTAAHVFRVGHPLVYEGSGSGDKTFDWVLSFCLLAIAAAGTIVWSILDRKRANYVTLGKWLRVLLRFALAGQMLTYGFVKIFPLQMRFPFLAKLIEPYGNFSPMGVLWWSIGAAPGYELFVGCAEAFGGILLIVPRLSMLGALVCLADMTQVFLLNMTYDVPVKLLSFHLLLMSLLVLAPEASRLWNFFFANRTVEPSALPALFATRRANHFALAAQLLFGLWILGNNVYGDAHAWREGIPKSPLYGIWNVEEMTIGGEDRPPLATDHDRWRRVIFDFANQVAFERFDDSLAYFNVAFNDKTKTITLNAGKNFAGNLAYSRSGADQMTLDGDFNGRRQRLQLRLMDRQKFTLVNRGFHWIQEYPFNR